MCSKNALSLETACVQTDILYFYKQYNYLTIENNLINYRGLNGNNINIVLLHIYWLEYTAICWQTCILGLFQPGFNIQ